jgi:hypothetical protein
MPYEMTTTYIPSETLFTHNDVSVFLTYTDGDIESPYAYWYTTDANYEHDQTSESFDVRTLSAWHPVMSWRRDHHRDVIEHAIETGEVTGKGGL